MEKGKDFDFKAYKIAATKDDIKRVKEKMKPKGWENIPFIGAIAYGIRMTFAYYGIDRGPFRQEIFKWRLIFMLAFLIYGYMIAIFVTPWFLHWVFSVAIKKTEERIKIEDL